MGRQRREEERKKKLVESESEEEQGRSGLGKRKRKKVVAEIEEQGINDEGEQMENLEPPVKDAEEQEIKQVDTRPKKKKNKKKRKHAD